MHRRSKLLRDDQAFTLIELLVVIAIIAILAGILFPVFAKAREKARQSRCVANLRQLAIGVLAYAQDYDEAYPHDPCALITYPNIWPGVCAGVFGDSASWLERVQPYMKNTQIFQCPSSTDPTADRVGYWANGPIFSTAQNGGTSLAAVTEPAAVIMAYDDIGGTNRLQRVFRLVWYTTGWTDSTSFSAASFAGRSGPHNETISCAFADGHAKALKNTVMFNTIWHQRAWP